MAETNVVIAPKNECVVVYSTITLLFSFLGTFFFIILVFSHSLPLALTKLEVEPVGLRLLDPEPSGSQAVEMKKKLYEASTGSNFTLYCFAEMTQPIIESTASSFMPKASTLQ